MNKYDYKYLNPFKWFILENFPFIEADFDALTNWQLFCKLGKEMNKIIDNLNSLGIETENLSQAFIDLQNYVNDYFENLDIQEEINTKLDEMAGDGTLEEIINQEIFSELNEKIENAMLKTDNQSYNNLTLERFMRYFVKNTNHPEYSSIDYSSLQGGCYSGNDKMVIVQNRSDTNNLLIEISLIDGSIIRQANINLGHGNSVAYDNEANKLYVAGLTGENNHKIYVINYTTFTLENTLILDTLANEENIHSVSYDYITKKFYVMTETLPTNFLSLYEYNENSGNLNKIELPDYENLITTTNTNDMCVYNDIVYIMKHVPQVIITYNIKNQTLQNLYNVNNTTELGIPVGELENISIMYDKNYHDLLIGTQRIECQNGFYNMFQFYKANPVYSVKKPVPLNNNLPRNIAVNINSTAINPDGTTGRPFKHIAEAFEICNNNPNLNMQIASGEYPYAYIYGLKGRVQAGGTDITINGLCINLCDYIYLYGITVNNTNSLQSYDIYAESSKARFSNCSLSTGTTANFDIHNTTLELNNCQNVRLSARAENNIICYDTTPDYKVLTGKLPNLNKAVKLCNGNLSQSSNSTTYDLSDNPILYNANNLKIMVHANFGYQYVLLPNRTNAGTRLFSILLNNWLITIQLTRTDTTIAFNIFSCKNITNNTVVDNTATATGDFIAYAEN